MGRYIYGTIVFLAGAVTMIFEIAGSRILGPYFGTSVFVWTSLIGVIMGSLSLGYWIGGRLSVKKADDIVFSWILAAAAFFIFTTAVADDYILSRILKYVPGFRLKTVAGSLFLFAPASLFLGMILPVAVRLTLVEVTKSGSKIGNLYALSTIGSIAGTFLTGFYLLPEYGFENVLFILPLLLLLFSMLLLLWKKRLLYMPVPVLIAIISVVFWIKVTAGEKDYVDVDTKYNRVIIYNTKDKESGRPVKMLLINDEKSSAMYTDVDSGLVFEVLRYYRLMEHFKPDFKKVLMIGGSGYAFPKYFLKNYPGKEIDVVEIDPGLTKLAKEYFNLKESPRLHIYHEDGRTFLNRNDTKYDAVLMDAYKSVITVPFQLTTVEAVRKIYNSLAPDGIVLANIISTLNNETDYFLRAELETYRQVFDKVFLFAVQYPNPSIQQKDYFQNFMLVGLKQDKDILLESADTILNEYLGHYINMENYEPLPVLTDEYAPVEYYTAKVLK